MKKYILAGLLLTTCFAGKSQTLQIDSVNTGYLYTTKFVFSGQIKNMFDSVFYIQYAFATQYFQQFSNLVMEDSVGQHIIDLSNINPLDSIEVRNAGKIVFVTKKNIDPNNPPVLINVVDKRGINSGLLQRTGDGQALSAQQIKEIKRLSREAGKRADQ